VRLAKGSLAFFGVMPKKPNGNLVFHITKTGNQEQSATDTISEKSNKTELRNGRKQMQNQTRWFI